MRIKVPLPRPWPVVLEGPPVVAEVLPGVTLTLGELEPLPVDLRAWGDAIVLGGLPPEQVRIGQVFDTTTETGWPVTLFGSDLIDPRSRAILERRLQALYRFDRFGGTATLRSASAQSFDAVADEVVAVLLKGAPDWQTGEICALSELFTGLTVEAPSAAPPRPGALPPQPMVQVD